MIDIGKMRCDILQEVEYDKYRPCHNIRSTVHLFNTTAGAYRLCPENLA